MPQCIVASEIARSPHSPAILAQEAIHYPPPRHPSKQERASASYPHLGEGGLEADAATDASASSDGGAEVEAGGEPDSGNATQPIQCPSVQGLVDVTCEEEAFCLPSGSMSSWRSAVVALRPAKANGAELSPTNTKKEKKTRTKASGAGSTAIAPTRDHTPPSPGGPRTSLGAGIVSPCYARIDWATLLRRIYLDDVLACRCGARRYGVAEINDREAIVAILNHLGLDPDPPVVARARDPTDDAT